jgi:hypothetical protein
MVGIQAGVKIWGLLPCADPASEPGPLAFSGAGDPVNEGVLVSEIVVVTTPGPGVSEAQGRTQGKRVLKGAASSSESGTSGRWG